MAGISFFSFEFHIVSVRIVLFLFRTTCEGQPAFITFIRSMEASLVQIQEDECGKTLATDLTDMVPEMLIDVHV